MISVSQNIGSFRINVSQDLNYEELKNDWIILQNTQDTPFFLTWNWILCWLNTYKPQVISVTASLEENPVCIGLFTQSIDKRHGFISSKQLRLHQIGDQQKDQIWIEYNDFICKDEYRTDAVNACLRVLQDMNEWDEIVLSMMPGTRADSIINYIRSAEITNLQPSYLTNIGKLRNSGGKYLDSLSRNTRYQIRKSIRIYEEGYGPIKIKFAQNIDEALELFFLAGECHLQRWDDSGYRNTYFKRFHENLIRSSFNQNKIDLVEVTSGSEVIAYLYFLKENNTVFFYLQGINYSSNNKLKPGLVSHTLIIQHYINEGYEIYDFMGGKNRYKTQLSKYSLDMKTVTISSPRVKFFIENLGRLIKNKAQSLFTESI